MVAQAAPLCREGDCRLDRRRVVRGVLKIGHYFQQRLRGSSYSAAFVAQGAVGDVRFVGITEQLIGESQLHAAPFAWCGNIGPVSLPIQIESGVRRVANFLKWKFGLRGLFGLDFVVTSEGQWGVTEINPRYPASLELLEFATGAELLKDHCESFAGPLELPVVAWEPATGSVFGKAILYAAARTQAPPIAPIEQFPYRHWPRRADVPTPGSEIGRGEPLLTVYAQAPSADDCRQQLLEAAAEVYAEL